MNGVLWKWTNYYSGWQLRWFILKDGILSYYRSEEEVQSGSKGSINLSVCDLNISSMDNTRFEIVIPGEQKYHLKSLNIQDRQRWIVAIGSCKACHMEPNLEISSVSNRNHSLPIKEVSSKESELRIYMELMNQQVMLLKNQLSENQYPDINAINDLTSTLNAASDTFLVSLKDLMSIISMDNFLMIDSPSAHAGSSIFSFNSTNEGDSKMKRHSSDNRSMPDNGVTLCRNRRSMFQEPHFTMDAPTIEARRKSNFFIKMTHSFVDWSKTAECHCTINTDNYINSFWSLLNFLDSFDASPIVSLKLDIIVYVKRLSQKYDADHDKFSTLESIIKSENYHSSQLNVDSATYVIRSLNRCLMFVEYFLQYLHDWLVAPDNQDDCTEGMVLKTILTRAYQATLETKMNWLDQGLFTIITKSLPSLSEFLCHLLCRQSDKEKPFHLLLESFRLDFDQLLVDMDTYRNSLATINLRSTQLLSDR